jgi:hypothetical protein
MSSGQLAGEQLEGRGPGGGRLARRERGHGLLGARESRAAAGARHEHGGLPPGGGLLARVVGHQDAEGVLGLEALERQGRLGLERVGHRAGFAARLRAAAGVEHEIDAAPAPGQPGQGGVGQHRTRQRQAQQQHRRHAQRQHQPVLQLQAALVALERREQEGHRRPGDHAHASPVEQVDHDRHGREGRAEAEQGPAVEEVGQGGQGRHAHARRRAARCAR